MARIGQLLRNLGKFAGIGETKKRRRRSKQSAMQRAVLDALEQRQLMSLTLYWIQLGNVSARTDPGHIEDLSGVHGWVVGPDWQTATDELLASVGGTGGSITLNSSSTRFFYTDTSGIHSSNYSQGHTYILNDMAGVTAQTDANGQTYFALGNSTDNGTFFIGTQAQLDSAYGSSGGDLTSAEEMEQIVYFGALDYEPGTEHGYHFPSVDHITAATAKWHVSVTAYPDFCLPCNNIYNAGVVSTDPNAIDPTNGQSQVTTGSPADPDLSTGLTMPIAGGNGETVGDTLGGDGLDLIDGQPDNPSDPMYLATISASVSEVFAETSTGSDQYVSTMDGSQTVIFHDTANHRFLLTDADGQVLQFSDTFSSTAASSVTALTDAGGNPTNFDYNGSGQVTNKAQITGLNSRISTSYTYNSYGQPTAITIKNTFDSGSTWTTTSETDYTYYSSDGPGGPAGALELVTVKDGAGHITNQTGYRYYDNTWFDSSSAHGYIGAIKYAFSEDSYNRLTNAGLSLATATNAEVSLYADVYYQYDIQNRIKEEVVQGTGCSACTGGLGTYTYAYAVSNNDGSDPNAWTNEIVQTTPDGKVEMIYTNSSNQTILDAIQSGGLTVVNYYRYDSHGNQMLHVNPSGMVVNGGTSYNDTLPDLVDFNGSESYLSSTTGLFEWTDYYSTSSATNVSAGAALNFIEDTAVSNGLSTQKIYQTFTDYYNNTVNGVSFFNVAHSVTFPNNWTDATFNAATSSGDVTTYAYSYMQNGSSNTNQIQAMTVSSATVISAHNGPGTPDVTRTVYDSFGRTIWTMDGDGYINYTKYDPVTGAVTESITDVNTTLTSEFSNKPAGWSTPALGGLNLITNCTLDSLGRTIEMSDPNGNITYTVYDDPDQAVFTFPGAHMTITGTTGSLTTTGPISMSRTGLVYSYTLDGQNWLNGTYDESMTFSGVVTVANGQIVLPGWYSYNQNLLNLTGNATSGSQYTIQSLSRSLMNAGSQQVESDQYSSIDNTTYFATGSGSPYSGYAQPSVGVYNYGSLTLSGSTLLDLTNHDAIIGNTSLATVQAAILSGYGIPNYSGPRIINSIGQSYGSTWFLLPISASEFGITSWKGVPITQPDTVIIANVLQGDANMDGVVDSKDSIFIANHTGTSTSGFSDMAASWFQGDIDFSGAVDSSDVIFDIDDYAEISGSPNINASYYGYDSMGRQAHTEGPTGTYTDTVYDSLGREQATFVGTQDVPSSDLNGWGTINWEDFTDAFTQNLSGNADTNMAMVSSNIYDHGGLGDGNLTESIQYPGAEQAERITDYLYDWRDRQITTKSGENLPAGWSDNQIAGPVSTGIAGFNGDSFTVIGSGQPNIGQDSDQFNFVSSSMTGSKTLIARVKSQNDTGSTSQAGLMFRDSTSEGARFASIVVQTNGTVLFMYRTTTDDFTSSPDNETGITGPIWVKIVRTNGTGNSATFAGYYSTDGSSWTQVGSTSVAFTVNSTYLGGLSVTASGSAGPSSAVFDNVSTNSSYTFAASRNESDNVHRPIMVVALDNMGEQLSTYSYDGDGTAMVANNTNGIPDSITIIDANGDGIPDGFSSSHLQAFSVSNYDEQGRTYQTITYNVNYTTGSFSTASTNTIVSNMWYDHRGDQIASVTSGGAMTKNVYDGAGRLKVTYTTDGGAVNNTGTNSGMMHLTWADANSVSNDIVLTQAEYTYDADSNIILTTTRDRFDTNATTSTGILLNVADTTGHNARVSYVLSYYDSANRSTESVNLGTNGGFLNGATNGGLDLTTFPSAPTASTDTILATFYTYNSAGEVSIISDPAGHKMFTQYDQLGQTLVTVNGWDGSYSPYTQSSYNQSSLLAKPNTTTNMQITAYTYDGAGHQITVTAVMPLNGTNSASNGAYVNQTTKYIYGGFNSSSAIQSNDALRLVEYPISSGTGMGTPGTASAYTETYTYDALGETLTITNRNGTTHTYTYDSLGRQTLDSASSKPTNTEYDEEAINDSGFENAGATNWVFSGISSGKETDPNNGSNTVGYVGYDSPSYGGAATQEISVYTGYYALEFDVADEAVLGQSVAVTVDGSNVGTFTPGATTFTGVLTSVFFLSGGPHGITFTSSSGQVLIDNVKLVYWSSLVNDTGFEDSGETYGNYANAPYSGGWTYNNNAGATADGSALSPPAGFDGSDMGFIQDDSSITQSFSMSPGTYVVSFLFAQSGGEGLDVTLNGTTTLYEATPGTGPSSMQAVTASFTIVSGGSYTLSYASEDAGGNAFLDDVLIWYTKPSESPGTIVASESIKTTYNSQGLADRITSYSAGSAGGTAINEVKQDYNGFGQMTAQWQNHSGTVTSSSPKTSYTYGSANQESRLTAITYPDGSTVNYSYGTSHLLNDVISRLDAITQGTVTLESYKYLGLATLVEMDHPQDGVNLTYISTGTSDSDDHYTGLDRFGRVIDQKWTTTGGTIKDEYLYEFDRDSNIVNMTNTQHTAFNVIYSYDNLNQLTGADRNDGTSSDQTWTLDALGNMTAVKTGTTTVNQTANALNELTTVGSGTLTYDPAGNMTTDTSGDKYTYDAWNRLAMVTDSTGVLMAAYTYDGTGRRIQEITNNGAGGTTTTDYYFNGQQDIQEKQGGTVTATYYWSAKYVDALIARNVSSTRLYATYDASYDVTSLLNTSGTVQERFVYNAYGTRSIYSSSWSGGSDSQNWAVGYQGLIRDAATGLWYNRARWYNDQLMRFINVDPARQGMNWYESRGDNPIGLQDPSGKFIPLIALLLAGAIILWSTNTANAPAPGDITIPAGNTHDLDILAFAASVPIGGFGFKITGNILGRIGVPLLGRLAGSSIVAGTSVTASTDLIQTGGIRPQFGTRAALNSSIFFGLGALLGSGTNAGSAGASNYIIRVKGTEDSVIVEGETCNGSLTRASFAGDGDGSPFRSLITPKNNPSQLPTVQTFRVTASQYQSFFKYLRSSEGTTYLKYGPTPIPNLLPGYNNCTSPISQGLNEIGALNRGLLNGPYGPGSTNWSPGPSTDLSASLAAAAMAKANATVNVEQTK